MSLYECHISVKIRNAWEEARWIQFCKENRYKPIHVINYTPEGCKSVDDRQYMMSKFFSRDNSDSAFLHFEEIWHKIEKGGFRVIRKKLEGMLRDQRYDIDLDDKEGMYWEFHAKIHGSFDEVISLYNRKVKESIEWCRHVALSMSVYSKEKPVIVTIRLCEGDRKSAKDIKDIIMNDLKKENFHIDGKIQEEISVFDDNQYLDSGWFAYSKILNI